MRALIKIIILAALSLSSTWAVAFVATAELDGFNVVPPVLTSKTTDDVCLEFASPWRIRTRQPGNEVDLPIRNIRLYFGQHFANGQPIATLCDQAISNLKCQDKSTDVSPNPGLSLTDTGGDFQLSDIRFQGQQVNFCCNLATIAGTPLRRTEEDMREDRLVLPNNEDGLAVIRALIERGLIYVVINSEFRARLRRGEIIGYRPTRGFIDGDGEIRGTLSVNSGLSSCAAPPAPTP